MARAIRRPGAMAPRPHTRADEEWRSGSSRRRRRTSISLSGRPVLGAVCSGFVSGGALRQKLDRGESQTFGRWPMLSPKA
eukprot:3794433-Prymnesium_polylepis.1